MCWYNSGNIVKPQKYCRKARKNIFNITFSFWFINLIRFVRLVTSINSNLIYIFISSVHLFVYVDVFVFFFHWTFIITPIRTHWICNTNGLKIKQKQFYFRNNDIYFFRKSFDKKIESSCDNNCFRILQPIQLQV